MGLLVTLLNRTFMNSSQYEVHSAKQLSPNALSTGRVVRLVNVHPHNVSAFTEGLVFDDGALIESTGLNGESFIRKYQLSELNPTYFQTGATESVPYLKEFRFDSTVFGEGVTVLGDKLFALTYKKQQVLVLSRHDFQLLDQFPLVTSTGEGWGLTTDGEFLIASDGSATVQFFDPRDEFSLHHNITVRKDGVPVTKVNELEYVEGELLANVWFEHHILRIDITSGEVLEQIDLDWMPNMVANIHSKSMQISPLKVEAVMNGIAYDPVSHHLFLTGKLWDSMFELELSYLNSHQQAIVP
ncbi:hypothetical protein BBO99_00007187 [Phytophthora kernoviae]|uniref:Glutamine cyclotransferase n=2 Tax=Phytophthora kernoviae TaxID=325452 RepID=A0A421GIJ1_9STRA|nr:hypothetical protein G195_011338 [Phytophthora kernoviae 00238/432]KAG2520424.1 hypothetical protein JM16_006728 [Phytophthora kernoviae]KAG2521467.1 hypothetical protein JM18_006590 [Phytophthora kernoviae]RLN37602.1 hypothetical protein BBI17_007144 [Phytophthora kernoviae]RLN76898.1 hypothetical protein BBO99_00007187 [Phytophthora kernoviae]